MKTIIKYKLLILTLFLSSCQFWENSTTYFNTFYNANRLKEEAEDDFAYTDEKKRLFPRSVLIEDTTLDFTPKPTGMPAFMKDYIISQQKLQPVQIKVDSIIIKGSKIMAKHSKSDYIENTVYLVALAYFYRSEWLPSEIKCSELIDMFPEGDFSPDAHLLMSKNLLIQRKYASAKTYLSKTIDVAWHKNRYDILSEAFKLYSELAIHQKEFEEAIRPYLQAILKCEDSEIRARWEVDLGLILYRVSRFETAKKMFEKALEDSPDYLNYFEANLYIGACNYRLKKYDSAEYKFVELDDDRKFDEWRSYIAAERMKSFICQNNDSAFEEFESKSDTAFVGSQAIMTANYEYGVHQYRKNDYQKAKTYFAKSKTTRSPVFDNANKMFSLLNTWELKKKNVYITEARINNNERLPDSVRSMGASDFFELARIHEQLNNKDSAAHYYKLSVSCADPNKPASARYFYSMAYNFEKINPELSDSLYDIVASKHPTTEYGIEARKKLGYTDNFVLDTAADLFKSGNSLRKIKDYNFSLVQYKKLLEKYPNSMYAPKSIYSIGWLYENPLKNYDSAYYYYSYLVSKYPTSEYARDILTTLKGVDDNKKAIKERDSLFKLGLVDSLGKPTKLMDSINARKQPIDTTLNALPSIKQKTESNKQDNKRIPVPANKELPKGPGAKNNPLNFINKGVDEINKILSKPNQEIDSLIKDNIHPDSLLKK